MLGDMDLNQINELKEEQTDEQKPRAKKKAKTGEWKYSWKVLGESRHLQPRTQNHLRCLDSGLFLIFSGPVPNTCRACKCTWHACMSSLNGRVKDWLERIMICPSTQT